MPETFKRGRLASDPAKLARCLRLERYVDFDELLPLIPLASGYASTQPWGMLGNDTVGDCTCAAAGHADQIAETYGDKKTPDVTPEAVLAAYSAITGYNPDDPNSDTGANMIDVLRYWQKTGIAGQKFSAYVAFDADQRRIGRRHLSLRLRLRRCLAARHRDQRPADHHRLDRRERRSRQQNGHCIITARIRRRRAQARHLGPTDQGVVGLHGQALRRGLRRPAADLGAGRPGRLRPDAAHADLAVVQGGGPLPAPTPAPTPAPSPSPTPAPAPTPVPTGAESGTLPGPGAGTEAGRQELAEARDRLRRGVLEHLKSLL